MSTLKRLFSFGAMLLALGMFTGCESTDSGGSSSVSGGVYYGTGLYDPWYYGGYYDHGDIIVTPPSRPDRPVHPEQPIYNPSPRPTPSIPSGSRPMARPAMRR
jgi:hypothetical protein